MIYVNENKALLCKGDFHPAELYKGETKIAGYEKTDLSGEGGVTLESCYNDYLHNAQITGNSVQDGTPTPDNPIEIQSVGEKVTEGDYAGKYKIPIKARGKNLFDYSKYSYSKKTSNGLTCEHIGNGIFHIYGTVTSYSQWINFQYSGKQSGIFKKGKKYKSQLFGAKSSGLSMLLGVANAEGQQITNITTGIAAFTIPSEGCYTRYVQVTVSYVSAGTTFDDYIQLQLEEETFTNTYEPYIAPQNFDIYLDEPLRKVKNYADYIDFENKKVIRKNKAITKFGSNKFVKYDNDVVNDIYLSPVGVGKNIDAEAVMCSYDSKARFSNAQGIQVLFRLDYNGIDYKSATAMEEWTQLYDSWVESGKFLLQYALKNPTEESIELPNLPTFKGTTIYEINTQIKANISGMYKKAEG